jgi:hypothetical protein
MIYVLLVLVLLLASLVLLPIGVELDYSERGRRWAIWWLGLTIPLPGSLKWLSRNLEARVNARVVCRTRPVTVKSERLSLVERIEALVNDARWGADAFRRGIETLRAVNRSMRIDVQRFEVTVATSNPAMTGFVYGMMWAYAGAAPISWPLNLDADFTRMEPKVSFRVRVSVTVIKTFPAIWRLAWFSMSGRNRPRNKSN